MQMGLRDITKIILLSGAILTGTAVGWHDTGHMVVAEIAYRHLDKEIVNDIDTLIARGAKEYPKNATFVTASVWADDIKQHGINFFNDWHYDDRYVSVDSMPVPAYNDGQAIKMLKTNINLLTSDRTTNSEKAFVLKMIIHMVGDMHQPMHNITRVSKAHPNGDLGGNLYKLKGKFKNLHSLWDSGLEPLPHLTRPLNDFDAKIFSDVVDEIISLNPLSSFHDEIISAEYSSWQTESHKIALDHAYRNITPNSEPTAIYLHENGQIAKQRLALAGYRLGNILNCAWDSSLCIK